MKVKDGVLVTLLVISGSLAARSALWMHTPDVVVCFGDSNTHGLDSGPYSRHLKVDTRTLGYRGLTTTELIDKVERFEAGTVLLQAGTNDLRKGEDALSGLKVLYAEIKRQNPFTRVIVGTVPPIGCKIEHLNPEGVRRFNRQVVLWAKAENIHLCDTRSLTVEDMIPGTAHLTPEGTKKLASLWQQALDRR